MIRMMTQKDDVIKEKLKKTVTPKGDFDRPVAYIIGKLIQRRKERIKILIIGTIDPSSIIQSQLVIPCGIEFIGEIKRWKQTVIRSFKTRIGFD